MKETWKGCAYDHKQASCVCCGCAPATTQDSGRIARRARENIAIKVWFGCTECKSKTIAFFCAKKDRPRERPVRAAKMRGVIVCAVRGIPVKKLAVEKAWGLFFVFIFLDRQPDRHGPKRHSRRLKVSEKH